MRVPGVVLVLLLVVAGCGSNSASEPAARTPAEHGDATAQKAVLTRALARFRAAGTGSYEAEVTADGVGQALSHETGSYMLKPVATAFERAILGIDEVSSKPRVQVVRVRSTIDHESFMQLKDWGTWTGCWLPMNITALSKQTGVDLRGSGSLPTPIAVLVRARVSSGHGLAGPHLAVNAYTALKFLGVSASAMAAQRLALVKVLVPVLLDVTSNGAPSGVAVEGSQVASAITNAGLTLSSTVAHYTAKAHAEVVLHDLSKPVHIAVPSAALLLPVDARADSTCPANHQ